MPALRLLFDRTDFERTPSMPYSSDALQLDRMRRLLARLGNPERSLSIVHLAGTKGKGSTATLLAAILSEAGYKTGLTTSPHILAIEERIAIDGQPIRQAQLVELIEHFRPEIEGFDRQSLADGDQEATFFELITALALAHFARQGADLAILETGLGGRLDATNVCQPLLSIITSISLDHTRQLGTTLAEIAREKAGIIKPGVPVLSGAVDPLPRGVIRQICHERNCPLQELGADFDFRYHAAARLDLAPALGEIAFLRRADGEESAETFPLLLPGRHQAANAALAIAACDGLRQRGWKIPSEAIAAALGKVVLPARVEVIARRPTVVLDAAHNVASVDALLATLAESFFAARRRLIFATTQEKDIRGMLALLLPRFDEVVLTRYTNNPRGVPVEELAAAAQQLGAGNFETAADPASAWRSVCQTAAADDLICITGSFFLAAELRAACLAAAGG